MARRGTKEPRTGLQFTLPSSLALSILRGDKGRFFDKVCAVFGVNIAEEHNPKHDGTRILRITGASENVNLVKTLFLDMCHEINNLIADKTHERTFKTRSRSQSHSSL